VNAGSTQAPIHECIFYPGSMELVQARLPRWTYGLPTFQSSLFGL
jgi:hypothetical protein